MARRKKSPPWIPDGVLVRPLILTSQADLSVFNGTIEVAAGAPYRITEQHGSVVRIEVKGPDGRIKSGYTVSHRVSHQRHPRWQIWRRH